MRWLVPQAFGERSVPTVLSRQMPLGVHVPFVPTAPITWNSAVVKPLPAPQVALSVHVAHPKPNASPGFSQATSEPGAGVWVLSAQYTCPPIAKSRFATIETQ